MTTAPRSTFSAAFFFRALRAAYQPLGGVGWREGPRPPSWVVFSGATLVQAAAHGALATSAGLLGQALLQRQFGSAPTVVDTLGIDISPLGLCLLGLGAAVVKTLAGALALHEQKRAAARAGDTFRREITDAILRAGQVARPAADTHAALAVHLRQAERGVDEGVLASARAIAHLMPLAGALIVLSSRLALISFAVLAPFAVALGLARRGLRSVHARASVLAEELHTSVDELVRHLDLWRTYGATLRIRRALEIAGERSGRAAAHAEAVRAAISGVNEVLAAFALLVTIALAERGVLGGHVDRGPLVAFAAVFFLMYRPLRDLGDARTTVERGAHALEALDGVHAGLEPVTSLHRSLSGARTEPWGVERLTVERLSVVHGDIATPPTSLVARPGEIVAVVGPTGAGKTSLLRALLGLERSMRGSVRYGTHDLGEAGVGPDERPFAWVPQEPAIIAGSVTDNVALGIAADATDGDTVTSALAAIGARSLRERGDVALSAGGPELSGGERQWVAIARAIASELPVLLLDEPTSGLDAASQRRVIDALAALRGRRTVLLVTHRPEPLAVVDRVVRIGDTSS